MTSTKKFVFIITLTENHLHYCKALIASVNYFHPNNNIILIKDGNFDTKYFNTFPNLKMLTSQEINNCHNLDLSGLLNKLNIFFLPRLGYNYDYFIHLDADSIFTSFLNFENYNDEFDFSILQGEDHYNFDNERQKKIVTQFAFNPLDFPEFRFHLNNLYFFSSSHFIVNANKFPLFIEHLEKYRKELNKDFSKDTRFKFGDQGFLNMIINHLNYTNELNVKLDNCTIFGYEPRKENPTLTLENVINKTKIKVAIIHYTGNSRRAKLIAHNYGEILQFFVKTFYANKSLEYNFSEIKRQVKYHYKWFSKRVKMKLMKWTKL